MLHALLLVLSCLADYETVRNLAQGAFTAGLLSTSVLCCIGTIFTLRRRKLFLG